MNIPCPNGRRACRAAGADSQARPRSPPLPSPSRRAACSLAARRYRNECCFASLCRFSGIEMLFLPPGVRFLCPLCAMMSAPSFFECRTDSCSMNVLLTPCVAYAHLFSSRRQGHHSLVFVRGRGVVVHLRVGSRAQALRCIQLRASYCGEAGPRGTALSDICSQSHRYIELNFTSMDL